MASSSSGDAYAYSLDIPPRLLVLQEIQQVTTALRRNPRWSFATSSHALNSGSAARGVIGRSSAGEGSESGTGNGLRRPNEMKIPSSPVVATIARPKNGEVDEVGIIVALVDLRRMVMMQEDVFQIPPIDILTPFLNLIRSPMIGGPLTALALTSVHVLVMNVLPCYLTARKFISALNFDESVPATPVQIAVSAITTALARCRFPSSSPAQDELVLLRLLKVTDSLVTGELETELTDEGVCEMLEVGLGMGGRARLGEGLRKTAQSSVQSIVRSAFLRLKYLDPKAFSESKDTRTSAPAPIIDGVKEAQTVQPQSVAVPSVTPSTTAPGSSDGTEDDGSITPGRIVSPNTDSFPLERDQTIIPSSSSTSTLIPPPHQATSSQPLQTTTSQPNRVGELPIASEETLFTPYGLPTLLELLRVLVTLLNPNDRSHTDTMRLSALGVLNSAIEVGGKHIGDWDELLDGLKDEGCRYLFQLIRSDNPALLALALRTLSTLFATLLPHLKLQFELFLTFLIDRLTPAVPTAIPSHLTDVHSSRPHSPRPSSTAGSADSDRPSTPRLTADLPSVATETKELMLDTLVQMMLSKSFMVDLWVNFDCDSESENVFERLVEFLTCGVYPSAIPASGIHPTEGLENTQLLCFEGLLSFVGAMNERFEKGGSTVLPPGYPTVEKLSDSKAKKARLLEGAAQFNAKPKRGVAFLRDNGLVEDASGPNPTLALARFLKSSSRLDKKLLGEYISQPDNLELLKAFIGLFDFRGKSIAEAMRELLEAFRLPGEASPIARITEVFAEHFFSYRPAEIRSQDAAYVLAYSVIMLNTDQHNPQNRKRMTIEDYQRNLRGVNEKQDFAPEYLAAIHDTIRKNEIIMPQEHVGQAGFDYAWKSLIHRSRSAGATMIANTSQFDLAMFTVSWQPLISAIASAFTSGAQDEYVIQRAIAGFRDCASLAGHFQLPEVFDTIVLSLSKATGLLDETDDGYQSANHPVVMVEQQPITVSPLSIRFGTSYRAQLATVVLFTIVNGNGNAIRQGWTQIFEMFQTLFLHSLLPPRLMQTEDFLSGGTVIPLKLNTPPVAREERRSDSGLLSTLSSYLLSPYGNAAETVTSPSQEDIENTLSAIDCLNACKLDELYAQSRALETDSLVAALHAIKHLAEDRCASRNKGYLTPGNISDAHSGRPPTPAYDEAQQPYDPAVVFDLEVMVSLVGISSASVNDTWPIAFSFMSNLIFSAQSYSILLIERAVVGLLRLCLIICDLPGLRDQVYVALDAIRSLPSSVLNAVAEQLMSGVAKILEKDKSVVRSRTEWGLITALFRATVSHPEASKVTLTLVQHMAEGTLGNGVTEENYAGIVAILDEFATAAGAAASRQQMTRRGAANAAAPLSLGPTVERGLIALDAVYELRNSVPGLLSSASILDAKEGWDTYWLPLLLVTGKQCVNGCRDIRHKSVGYLQRLLLSPQLLSSEEAALPAIFNRILFPVFEELLKPQVYQRDPAGMEETRLRASTVLCKAFLQHLNGLARDKRQVATVFLRVLDLLDRFMRAGGRDQVYESVPESLKNVLLVMHSSGLLVPPIVPDTRSPEQQGLWQAAFERIERFLPGFVGDVIPTRSEQNTSVSETPVVA